MKSHKDIDIEEVKKVASLSMAQYNINRYLELFTNEELVGICRSDHANVFSDMNIVDNDLIRTNFPWAQLKAKRACRIFARLMDSGNESVLDEIDFTKLKVKIKDIKSILIRDPMAIHRFKKDLSKISDNDAAALLELGNEYFLKNINIKGRKFTEIQQYAISKAYGHDRAVLALFDPNKFDGFHVSEIIKATQRESLDILSLERMKIIDWISLLSHSPHLYDLCDAERYRNAPIMFLIELAMIVDDPALYEMICKSDLNDITPLGWERLIHRMPEMFVPLCDTNKYDPNSFS